MRTLKLTSTRIIALVAVATIAVVAATVLLVGLAAGFDDDPPITMHYVCDDFAYQEEAQWWFDLWVDEYPELRSLDGDNNGIACQSIPSDHDLPAVAKRLNRLERQRGR